MYAQASATHFTVGGERLEFIDKKQHTPPRKRRKRNIPDSLGPNYLQNISAANLNREHAVSGAKYWQTQRVRQKNS